MTNKFKDTGLYSEPQQLYLSIVYEAVGNLLYEKPVDFRYLYESELNICLKCYIFLCLISV